MIEYLEILDKIQNIDEEFIQRFNKKVSIPLVLSNLDAIIKIEDKNIIIQKQDKTVILEEIDRKAFFEILMILKKIDKKLFNKIEFRYIDFFEKFKINYEYDEEFEFSKIKLENFTLDILAMLNVKFWCETDIEKKEFLNKLKTIKKEQEKKLKKQNENSVNEKEEIVSLTKNTWWNKILNKFRELKNKAQKY